MVRAEGRGHSLIGRIRKYINELKFCWVSLGQGEGGGDFCHHT